CFGGGSCVSFDVTAGSDYLIRASGFGGDTGNLTLNLSLAGFISGNVTDAGTAASIPDVELDIYDSNGNFVGYAYSDASGDYTSTALAAGSYFVRTGSANYVNELYDNIPCDPFCDPATGTPISVTGGSTTAGIDFALDLGGTISG